MNRLPFKTLRPWTTAAVAVLGVTFATACSEPAPPPPPPAPPVKTAQERVQMYQDCWNAFNKQEWDKFGQCYADNALSESVDSTPPSATGRAAIIDRDKQLAAAFPDRQGDVQLVLSNGARIMSISVYTGTNSGPMPGPDGKPMPATNKKIGFYLGHTLEYDATGAQGVKDAAYVEEGTMLTQLGVIKNPNARKAMTATGAPATVVIATNDEKERNNIGYVQSLIEASNKHDFKAIEGFMADDYKLIEIGQPRDMNRKDAIAGTKEFFAAFPDMKMTPAATWAAGDYVVLEGSLAGTNKGAMPSMGITKPTNKPFQGRFLEVMKLSGGKLTEDWLFYNGTTLAAQLGLK